MTLLRIYLKFSLTCRACRSPLFPARRPICMLSGHRLCPPHGERNVYRAGAASAPGFFSLARSRTRASGPLVNFALMWPLRRRLLRTLQVGDAFYPPARTAGGDLSEAGTGKVARNIAARRAPSLSRWLGHLRTSDTPSCLVLREELLKARSVFQDPLHEEPLDPSRLAVVSMLPSTVGLAFGCTASRTMEAAYVPASHGRSLASLARAF